MHGLRPEAHGYLNDSFWPMILGETGWLGLLFFVCALVWLFKKIQHVYSVNQGYYISGIVLFGYLLIASIAESVFVHPQSMPAAIILGVFISYNCLVNNEEKEGNVSK